MGRARGKNLSSRIEILGMLTFPPEFLGSRTGKLPLPHGVFYYPYGVERVKVGVEMHFVSVEIYHVPRGN